MANSHKSNIKDQTLNEKLYAHSHFKLLECREHKVHSNAICVIRDLIRQSNVHCSEQNMTVLGTKQFKTELYTEYAKLVDNQNQESLLSVVNTDGNNIIFSQPDPRKEQFILDALIKFKNYLRNDSSAQNPRAKNFNPARPVISANGGVGRSIFSNKEQTKAELNKMDTYNGFSNKRLPKKTTFGDHYGNKACSNKKICVQSNVQHEKLSTEPEIGFVSASTMYRNPLKKVKACNTSNSPTYGAKADSETSQASQLGNHDTLKHFDKKIVDIVLNEIMDFSPDVTWNDIAGLDFVKSTVQEIVIWPFQRPELFTGLRSPPRGILLFGPPGTGKTLIGKCIATESNSTFFCISASSLASKWVGESEQMVRVLFAAARLNQPAVIFVDEIDSLLSQRSDKDQDFTRKLKTEFLVQFDGAKTNSEERVLVVGATNRPHELDEAARRRFVKRLYVPLPDRTARRQIIIKLLIAHKHSLSDDDLHKICDETDGYSGSDVAHLCKEAAMGPIRSIGPENIRTISLDQVPPISLKDFINALKQVRASVVADDLNYYMEWNKKFGCTS